MSEPAKQIETLFADSIRASSRHPAASTGRTEDCTLLADKAYDSNAIRDQAQEQDVWANILPKSNRKGSFVFSAFLYRYRNLVERFFNKRKQFRAVATRYDKNPDDFLAAIKLISARIWIRSYESAA